MNDRKIKEAIVATAGCILAIFAGYVVSAGGDRFFALIASFCLAVGFWFLAGEVAWTVLFATMYLTGNFNFIPLDLRPFELCATLLLCRFVINHIFLQQKGLRIGIRSEFILLFGVLAVVALHAVKDKLGMRILGSSVWGGRAYITVILCSACYVAVLSSKITRRELSWLPWVCLVPPLFELAIQLATYSSMGAAMFIFQYYSAVSTQSLVDDTIGRIGAYGNLGIAISQLSLSYLDFRLLMVPRMLAAFLVAFGGLILAVIGGFRSSVLSVVISFVAASFRDLRWKALGFIVLAASLLMALPMIHVSIHPLPLQMQRSLAWMPGDWNWNHDVLESMEDSNFFRLSVWEIWYKTKFKQNPLMGRGFGFNFEEFNAMQASLMTRSATRETEFESYVVNGVIHNTLLSTIDRVGIVGAVFTILWIFVLGTRVIKSILESRSIEISPTTKMLCLVLTTNLLTYWFGALSFEGFLPVAMLASALLQKSQQADQEYRDELKRAEPVPPRTALDDLPETPAFLSHS